MARTILHLPLRLLVGLSLAASACGGGASDGSVAAATASSTPLAGRVTMDGSSTVFPMSKTMADGLQRLNPGVEVAVQSSGTGGGFKKFCTGEVDIAGASRPIDAEESRQCQANRIGFVELPVAFDSLVVVVNNQNTFAQCLTVPELKKIWEPAAEGRVSQWNQVRTSFPSQRLALFGPGGESGTFDYFTLAVVGTARSSRSDYSKSGDDDVLVNGVAADVNALGYFGAAYYLANREKLRLVAIDNGHGCVAPSMQTVEDATYQPLSRPLFIYVSQTAATRREVSAFARFFVAPERAESVRDVGYVSVSTASLLLVARRLDRNLTGSIFKGRGSVVGVRLNFVENQDRIKNALVQ